MASGERSASSGWVDNSKGGGTTGAVVVASVLMEYHKAAVVPANKLTKVDSQDTLDLFASCLSCSQLTVLLRRSTSAVSSFKLRPRWSACTPADAEAASSWSRFFCARSGRAEVCVKFRVLSCSCSSLSRWRCIEALAYREAPGAGAKGSTSEDRIRWMLEEYSVRGIPLSLERY